MQVVRRAGGILCRDLWPRLTSRHPTSSAHGERTVTDSRAERRAALIAVGIAAPLALLTIVVATRFGPLMSLDRSLVQQGTGLVQGNNPVSYTHLTLPTNREV